MIEFNLLSYLIAGLLLGAGSGITPGPLNTLIISESLKHGKSAGVKIAIAPLITDIPIIFLTLILVIELSKISYFLAIFSVFGGLYISYLGLKDLLLKDIVLNYSDNKNDALRKGITTNLLTPHPYVFWITVGAPTIINAYQFSILSSAAFVVSFYLVLVGFKILLALFTDKMRNIIHQSNYLLIIKILGFLLILFGSYLLYDGISKLFYS